VKTEKKRELEETTLVPSNPPLSATVEAPNFAPLGNFGPLFQKSLLSLKRVLQKNNENESCRNPLDLQIRFYSFLVHDSSKEVTELANKGPKFPWGPRLQALRVVPITTHEDRNVQSARAQEKHLKEPLFS
jgi:hypothetical protein